MPRVIHIPAGPVAPPRSAWSIPFQNWFNWFSTPQSVSVTGTCPGIVEITADDVYFTAKRVALNGIDEIIIQEHFGGGGTFIINFPGDNGNYPFVAVVFYGSFGTIEGVSSPGCPP